MNRRYMLAAAIALAWGGTTAQAADPLPDSLSLGGVTLYGTIDIGYAYQSHGVPSNGQFPGGLEYQAFTTTRNFGGSVSTFASSGLEQSKIGVRVLEPIGYDWSLVARVETGINPLSAQLTDACASIASNSGPEAVKLAQQTANADSSRCGQFFNAQAFGGMSNPQFGQLTIGRHNSLMLDALAVYDPQSLSYAFSYFGYSGTVGGAGSTEAARWDNSGRYWWQNPNFHVGIMYSNGGADTGIIGKSYAGQLGITFAGFSADAVYENEKGAVNLRSAFDNPVDPLSTPTGVTATGTVLPPPGLAAYISENTSYSIMAKYTFELGSAAQKDKLTLYAGYSHLEKAHADYTSGNAQGSYPIDVGININNSAVYNVEWAGVRYAFASGLNLVASFIHIDQNSWTIGLGTNGNQGVGCSAAGLLCAGDFWESAFVVDYIFNKHYDVYAGVNYSEVTDGLANGFPGTTADGTTGSQNQTTFMVGGRVKF
jgi:predicted porin